MNTYQLDDLIQINGNFTDRGHGEFHRSDHSPLYIQTPDGIVAEYTKANDTAGDPGRSGTVQPSNPDHAIRPLGLQVAGNRRGRDHQPGCIFRGRPVRRHQCLGKRPSRQSDPTWASNCPLPAPCAKRSPRCMSTSPARSRRHGRTIPHRPGQRGRRSQGHDQPARHAMGQALRSPGQRVRRALCSVCILPCRCYAEGRTETRGFAVEFHLTPAQEEAMTATVAQNVSLIRSIPEQHLKNVEEAVMRSVQTGRDVGGLMSELREVYGVTKRRASLIARSRIERPPQRSCGSDNASWASARLSGDIDRRQRARPTHLANNGKRYDVERGWLDPAVDATSCRGSFRIVGAHQSQ